MMSEIKGISCNNEWCLIEGKVPLNTSKDYASEVSSYTKGLGTFMVKPCGYQITKGGYSDNTRMEERINFYSCLKNQYHQNNGTIQEFL